VPATPSLPRLDATLLLQPSKLQGSKRAMKHLLSVLEQTLQGWSYYQLGWGWGWAE